MDHHIGLLSRDLFQEIDRDRGPSSPVTDESDDRATFQRKYGRADLPRANVGNGRASAIRSEILDVILDRFGPLYVTCVEAELTFELRCLGCVGSGSRLHELESQFRAGPSSLRDIGRRHRWYDRGALQF